jgi:hypothetical protein
MAVLGYAPWITLVQQAGITSTVSGPAAFKTYLRARESLHPAHADVHLKINSSLGISVIKLSRKACLPSVIRLIFPGNRAIRIFSDAP